MPRSVCVYPCCYASEKTNETAYGRPPTDVEAVAQNQAALVWWKIQDSCPPERQGSRKTPGDGGASAPGRAGSGGEATAAGAGLAGGGGKGTSVVGGAAGSGGGGDGLMEDPTPETVGFVVYRYRLDGREWHKKGATSVDDARAVCASIKALSNGLVYR